MNGAAGDSDVDADTVLGTHATALSGQRDSVEEVNRGDTIIARSALGPSVVEPTLDNESAVRQRYALSIGSHPPIPLEVPVIVGRRPQIPRISGKVVPRLVTVPSPSKHVSATHVEVKHEGDSVVVTDLGSTNGTIVVNPGNVPFGLRQGESVVIVEGSTVDIGDGIRFTIIPERVVTTEEGVG